MNRLADDIMARANDALNAPVGVNGSLTPTGVNGTLNGHAPKPAAKRTHVSVSPAKAKRKGKRDTYGRFDLLNRFVDDWLRVTTCSESRVWLVLWRNADTNRRVRIGVERMAELSRLTPSAVKQALSGRKATTTATAKSGLIGLGLVRRLTRGRLNRGVTEWEIRLPDTDTGVSYATDTGAAVGEGAAWDTGASLHGTPGARNTDTGVSLVQKQNTTSDAKASSSLQNQTGGLA